MLRGYALHTIARMINTYMVNTLDRSTLGFSDKLTTPFDTRSTQE